MRKPRDIDLELKALDQKAKLLRARKVAQLGELVIGCGADALPVELLADALLMAVASKDASTREAWRERGTAFFQVAERRRPALLSVDAALRRLVIRRNRLEARLAHEDRRDWQVKRRERTRQLIELGGLVVKAGLVELIDDDRTVIFGLLMEAAARLRSEHADQLVLLWRRRGQRGFVEAAASKEIMPSNITG